MATITGNPMTKGTPMYGQVELLMASGTSQELIPALTGYKAVMHSMFVNKTGATVSGTFRLYSTTSTPGTDIRYEMDLAASPGGQRLAINEHLLGFCCSDTSEGIWINFNGVETFNITFTYSYTKD